MAVSRPSDLTVLEREKFEEYVNRGKKLVEAGKVREGMESMKQAVRICETEKLLSRIKKCENYLAECSDEEEEATEVAKGFNLSNEIYKKLYVYQREGIAWMWKLFNLHKGGVLGDDMGLGKTIQVIGFLSGMFGAQHIKHVLIVMPVSLLANWEKEFNKWCSEISLHVYHGNSKKERGRNLYRIQRRGGVLLTSYGLVVSNEDSLTSMDGKSFVWDYVILDEGHKIKNPNKTTKAIHNLASKNRLVLTGTPLQNNLEELWALYDFAHQGTLLGSKQTFKMQYEIPVLHARAKGSTIGERKLGTDIAENLRKLIEPYFLRRTKDEVLKQDGNIETCGIEDIENQFGNMRISPLSRKNDLILWTFLSDVQLKIYTGFLQSESVKRILMTKKSPLVQLTVLKKICDHPRLLSNKQGYELLLNDDISEDDINRVFDNDVVSPVSIDNVSDETLISESGKLIVLIPLLEKLCSEGHRTLVFSQSRKILDIIQRILKSRLYKVLRIDGTIIKREERERIVDLFQKDSSYSVLLLTTQVGGVGLTLTGADRVVIYDPSWNPATDAQAVDRAYRIGQAKNVIVYRLISCGTVEEKIYRRQIFKDSIIKQATGGNKDPHRYFTNQELYELFTVDNIRYSTTQVQLAELHSHERKTDIVLDEHIAFLHSLEIFGISDHDLMFTKDIKDDSEDNDEKFATKDDIQIRKRVLQAQQMVQIEATLAQEDIRRTGSYARPLSVPPTRKASVKSNYNPPNFIEDFSYGKKIIEVDIEEEELPNVFCQGDTKNMPIFPTIGHVHGNYKPPDFVQSLSYGRKVDDDMEFNEKDELPEIPSENPSDDHKPPKYINDYFASKKEVTDSIKSKEECKEYDVKKSLDSPCKNQRYFHLAEVISENSRRSVHKIDAGIAPNACDSKVDSRSANNSVIICNSPIVTKRVSSVGKYREKRVDDNSEQKSCLNALNDSKLRSFTRSMVNYHERSLMNGGRADNSEIIIPSADASAEILVSESDSEEEMKWISPPRINDSLHSSSFNCTLNVDPDSSLSVPLSSASLIEDSFLDENKSKTFQGDIVPMNLLENDKLSRFGLMPKSFAEEDKKVVPACSSSLGSVGKDPSHLSQVAELHVEKEINENNKTPVKCYNRCMAGDIISKNVLSSPRRITPLRVISDTEAGACGSPFAKAVAQSSEMSKHVNTAPDEIMPAETEQLNVSNASEAASPVAVPRKKKFRNRITSDSENSDIVETNSEEEFPLKISDENSLSNFIESDSEEEVSARDDNLSTSDEEENNISKCKDTDDESFDCDSEDDSSDSEN